MRDPLSSDTPGPWFPLLVGATLAVLFFFSFQAWPHGPAITVERRINVLDGINGIAWVEDGDGRAVRVHLPTRHYCGVGDRIQLTERRTLWGRETKVSLVPKPCSR